MRTAAHSQEAGQAYVMNGGRPVEGRVTALGAKNLATKAMVGALLSEDPAILTNIPAIGDIAMTRRMFDSIGVVTDLQGDRLTFDPSQLSSAKIAIPDSRANRIPILLLGVLLHRLGEAHVPLVSGCNIGPRPLDFHLEAVRLFGASVETTDDGYSAYTSGKLTATHYELPYPSVGATETCLFLACLAEGTSVIRNVATEPEILALITMLNAMGAQIELDANRMLTIEGVDQLSGAHYAILGDRIEAASWACLAAATNGDITVAGIQPTSLVNFFGPFNAVGGGIEVLGESSVRFFRRKPLQRTMLETDVYPGFATDWQQPFGIMLTQADGTSVVHETVYERRFGYLDDLRRLGAKVQLEKKCLGSRPCRFFERGHAHSALITGPTRLVSDNLRLDVPDLRAGLAYVVAGALAEGRTILLNADLIERGYGNLPERVADLSLDLTEAT
ncbi:MAG: UDP-N-acetylglucosamine 1-carboxyvinyltransferase [Alphaproteobacteria bacterium]|nr:UDP-N-acetylglucosamine 1-carboxyvinyltransferase [Alphaproteobacteria bacterium]